MKKLLTAVLAVSLFFSILSGCGQSPAENSSSDSTASVSSVETSTSSEFTGYPVKTEDTLSVWSVMFRPQSSYSSWKDSPFHTGLAKETGINVEWQYPPAGTDNNQALNLLVASGNLPDIMMFWIGSDAQRYIDEKVIMPLNGLLEKNSPNYWAMLQDNKHFDKTAKTDKGDYFGYLQVRETEWAATYVGPVVRKDWLSENGLTEPTTISEWDKVIRTFKDKYGSMLSFRLGRMSPGISGAFGSFGGFIETYYIDNNGNIQLAQAQPEWKNFIAQMHNWYADGLIDPDVITLDDAGVRTKALNNKSGISITSMANLTNWIADAKKENTGAEWTGIQYPAINKGDIVPTIQTEDVIVPTGAMITTACTGKKLETAMRWLDFGYSDKGSLYWNYGTEGTSYTMQNGKPVFTDLILKDPEGTGVVLEKYIGTAANAIGIQATDMVKQKNDPASVAAVDQWLLNQEASKYLLPAGLSQTTEEINQIGAISNQISTYVQEMALKFLTGKEPIENYDKFVDTLKEIGLDKVLAAKQEAYKRFSAR